MKKILIGLCAISALSFSVINTSAAQSACVGLSSPACSAKSSMCTWRKGSVDKNGKKTKSHCRALPGKATKSGNKAKSATANATSKKTKSNKEKVVKKTSSANKKTTSKATKAAKKKTTKPKK